MNEYFYELDDKKLLDLVIQITGVESKSSVARQTLSTLKTLKTFADFNAVNNEQLTEEVSKPPAPLDVQLARPSFPKEGVGLNLSYTINLNLPATSDQAVFNAIFRSLKEHLLTDDE